MNTSDRQHIKASLIAGLKLWGLPNIENDIKQVREWAEIFGIDLSQFKKEHYGSGLMWGFYTEKKLRSKIVEEKFSDRLKNLVEDLYPLFIDPKEAEEDKRIVTENVGFVGDAEYVFRLDGEGFTGYMQDDGLLNKNIRDKDGKLRTFAAENCNIYVYEMDIDTKKDAIAYVNKLMDRVDKKKKKK
jgi:hypothetical protein